MEFPTLGENCQYENCNQIDFLPIQCKCGKVFCREHFNAHCISGECKLAPKPKDINFDNNDKIYKCSQKGCRKGNLHEMVCAKCNHHYCIEHRFHPSCPEIDDATMAKKVEEYEGPRRQFQEANKDLQEKITENIRKALQSSTKVKTASKIHLMRIKQKALGPKTVSASDRLYFAIRKPLSAEAKPVKIITNVGNLKTIETILLEPDLKDAVPVFINSKWTLGKAIDCICDTCHINNDNNKVGDVKLRMFRQLDGYCISPFRMDVEISELVTQEVLLEGDKLIFEYIDSKVLTGIDNDSHIFLNL